MDIVAFDLLAIVSFRGSCMDIFVVECNLCLGVPEQRVQFLDAVTDSQ